MVFSSHSFLVFMAALLLVYGLVSRRWPQHAQLCLTLASLFFYGFWIPKYLVLLLLSLAVNYALAGQIARAAPARQGTWLALGVTLNLALIAHYKYLDLLLSGLNTAFDAGMPLQHIVLPIGISFFTFQQIGYLVDTRYRRAPPTSFHDYAFFITFFPQLIAGPIVLQSDFLPQLKAPRNWRLQAGFVALGLALFSFGLFKKTVMADNIGRYVDTIFKLSSSGRELGLLDAWVGASAYGFQIYFDFSGYSDMAAGLAFLFGFRMPLNFFSPYKATSIIEFWRRWHISLSHFLRDYLYIPLGGSRHGFTRTMAALMLTMLLGGLWHGAGLNYVVWGGLHGLFLVLNHSWRRWVRRPQALRADHPDRTSGIANAVTTGIGVLLTFAAVSLAWVYFRAENIDQANRFALAMLGQGADTSFTPTTRGVVTFIGLYFLAVWCLPNTAQIFQRFELFIMPKHLAGALESAAQRQAALNAALRGEALPEAASNLPPNLPASLTTASPTESPTNLQRAGRASEPWLRYRLNLPWALVTAATFTIGWFAISNLSPFLYFQF